MIKETRRHCLRESRQLRLHAVQIEIILTWMAALVINDKYMFSGANSSTGII